MIETGKTKIPTPQADMNFETLSAPQSFKKTKPSLYYAGANYAADAIILRRSEHARESKIAVLQIKRKDGTWAAPGGFVDLAENSAQQESPLNAAIRELFEEALEPNENLAKLLVKKAQLIYSGKCNDPRNTLETEIINGKSYEPRWVESKVFLFDLTNEKSLPPFIFQKDRREVDGIRWIDITDPAMDLLYADHTKFMKIVAQERDLANKIKGVTDPLLADISQIKDLPAKRIAILGGSFDPPHLGHLEIANYALKSSLVDAVIFVPAGQNPLKPISPTFDNWQRIAMLRLMLRRQEGLYICPNDIFKTELTAEPSYTVDLLKLLHANKRSDQELFLLQGSDVYQNLPKFKKGSEIPSLANILVVPRSGEQVSLRLEFPATILSLPQNTSNVSATMVRNQLSADDPNFTSLLHKDVAEFIIAEKKSSQSS